MAFQLLAFIYHGISAPIICIFSDLKTGNQCNGWRRSDPPAPEEEAKVIFYCKNLELSSLLYINLLFINLYTLISLMINCFFYFFYLQITMIVACEK